MIPARLVFEREDQMDRFPTVSIHGGYGLVPDLAVQVQYPDEDSRFYSPTEAVELGLSLIYGAASIDPQSAYEHAGYIEHLRIEEQVWFPGSEQWKFVHTLKPGLTPEEAATVAREWLDDHARPRRNYRIRRTYTAKAERTSVVAENILGVELSHG